MRVIPHVFAAHAFSREPFHPATIGVRDFPNVNAVARQLAGGNAAHEQQLTTYAARCVDPAFEYFSAKFDNDLQTAMQAFKVARFFSPIKISR